MCVSKKRAELSTLRPQPISVLCHLPYLSSEALAKEDVLCLLPRPLPLHPRQGFTGDPVIGFAAKLRDHFQELRRPPGFVPYFRVENTLDRSGTGAVGSELFQRLMGSPEGREQGGVKLVTGGEAGPKTLGVGFRLGRLSVPPENVDTNRIQ